MKKELIPGEFAGFIIGCSLPIEACKKTRFFCYGRYNILKAKHSGGFSGNTISLAANQLTK